MKRQGFSLVGLVSLFLVALAPATSKQGCLPAPLMADGTDQTVAIQSYIDAAPDGSCIAFKPGSYHVEGTVTIRGRTNLSVEGNGATFYATAPGPIPSSPKGPWRVHWLMADDTGIRLRDFAIDGPNATGTFDSAHGFEHGVAIQGGSGVTLQGLAIAHTYGDGIMVTEYAPGCSTPKCVPPPPQPAQDIAISGGRITAAGRQGVSVISAQGVSISGTVIDSAARSIIDLETDNPDQMVGAVAISGLTVGYAPLNFVGMGGPGVASNIVVIANHLTGMSMHGKIGSPNNVVDRFGITFESNTSDVAHAGSAPLISLLGVSGFDFIGNVQPFASAVTAITLDPTTCHVRVDDNMLTEAGAAVGEGCDVQESGNVL